MQKYMLLLAPITHLTYVLRANELLREILNNVKLFKERSNCIVKK